MRRDGANQPCPSPEHHLEGSYVHQGTLELGHPPWRFGWLVNVAELSHVWFSFEEWWPNQ